jgi:predicted O-linked N-acetylglucosamine transferase (SPINDLY family)
MNNILFEQAKDYLDQSNYEKAIALLEQCIENNPEEVNYYWYLGLAYLLQGNEENAQGIWMSVFLQGTAEDINIWTIELINILKEEALREREIENQTKAIDLYLAILALNDQDAYIWHELGKSYIQLQQYFEAEEAITRALTQNNKKGEIYLSLGLVLEKLERFEFARQAYQQAIKLDSKLLDAYKKLVILEHDFGTFESTLDILLQGLKNFPEQLFLYQALTILYQNTGNIKQANQIIEKAIKLFPNDLASRQIQQTLLPIIYENTQEINNYRKLFIKNLEQLIKFDLTSIDAIDQGFNLVSTHTNFFLHYQGKNDIEVQQKYGNFVHHVVSAKYPQEVIETHQNKLESENKIRIGYLSPSLRNGVVADLFLNWLKYTDRDKFEIFCYSLNYANKADDNITYQFQEYSDHFYELTASNIEQDYKIIANSRLNILVFLDLGMEPMAMPFAGKRFAPVQCVAWGHPITSGLPTIDYFLSSEAMEPPDADQHYTETLIRLPGLGVICSESRLIQQKLSKKRSDFGLPENKILYLSCQNFCKYLPQYDYIFAEIVSQVPDTKLIFIERSSQGKTVTNLFRQRLKVSFDKLNLNINNYCLFSPPLNIDDYFQVLKLVNIFLDTFEWSGGITSLDALACSLPMVTHQGNFMRSRQSYGMLKIIGVTETIAQNEAEYIDIAVRLGRDHQWRKTIQEKIRQNTHLLYQNTHTIKKLEEFYLSCFSRNFDTISSAE